MKYKTVKFYHIVVYMRNKKKKKKYIDTHIITHNGYIFPISTLNSPYASMHKSRPLKFGFSSQEIFTVYGG